MNKRILVLGDGLLGTEIVKQTGWDYISRKKDGIDITNPESYIDLLKNCTHIVNCIGYTNTKDNIKNKHLEINVRGVYCLAKVCEKLHVKLIHISTDYVYANSHQDATENDLPVPLPNWYGHSKVMADTIIQTMFPDESEYLILRGTFKSTPYTHERAWYNLVGNFDYIDVIASLMIKLIDNDACGLYNVGTEQKNLYDLAKRTKPDVQMDGGDYSTNKYHRPYYTTMDLTKMKRFLDGLKK